MENGRYADDEALTYPMIAFRIKINGRRIVTAGLPGNHVLSAIASSVVRAPDVVKLARPRRGSYRNLKFELGGL